MASSLSRQLASIAASSTNPLDLRAQRNAHSQSLLFDKNVAATQDFDTIYDYCMMGYTELCRLEPEFSTFSNSIFSEASKTRERGQLTVAENATLDTVLERFITLSCKYLLLQPAQKALEWLIRRFRVHEFNTECLVLTFLIYHPLPIFSTLLSILPKQLPTSLKFLHPYRARLQALPGQVIQHATNNNTHFLDAWSGYIIKSCRWGYSHEPMLSYWTIRVSCAVEAQLNPTKAGSAQVQRDREENVVRRFTNIIDKCLIFRKAPSVIIGCYIIIERLVLAANLNDKVISTFMDAIANSAVSGTYNEALMSLAMLAEQRKTMDLSPIVAKFITKLTDPIQKLKEKAATTRMNRLAHGLAMELVSRFQRGETDVRHQTLLQLIHSNLLNDRSLELVMEKIISIAGGVSSIDSVEPEKAVEFKMLVFQLAGSNESSRVVKVLERIISKSRPDGELTVTIRTIMGKVHETENMSANDDGLLLDLTSKTSNSWLDDMPESVEVPLSYLAGGNDDHFNKLATVFAQVSGNQAALQKFLDTRHLNRQEASISPTFVSFLARFWCSSSPAKLRATAISCVIDALKTSSQIPDVQILLPYILTALADPVKLVRAAAASLVMQLSTTLQQVHDATQVRWNSEQVYGSSKTVSLLNSAQLRTIIQGVLFPNLEELEMDNLALQQVIHNCLTGSSSEESRITPEKLKKSSRAAFLSFIADHANITPVLRTKLALLNMTEIIHKAGHLSRYEVFEPVLQTWILSSDSQLLKACSDEKLQADTFCSAIIKIVPTSSATGNRQLQNLSSSIISKTFLECTVEYLRSSWSLIDSAVQSEWALLLFQNGVLHRGKNLLSEFALDTLSSLQLSPEILEQFLNQIMSILSEPDNEAPTTKRRKLTNGTSTAATDIQKGQLTLYLGAVTALLDLIRTAGSAAKCTLLPGLFRVFETVQQSKSGLQNDLNYVHWLLLTGIKEIISNADRSELNKIDHSDIRTDLVVDTLTHTLDPQTQYASLLLLSSLAKLEPELVVHSMMPVFTFIGSNLLKENNDHAAHVITQTIDSVIPPLVASFRQQKGGSLAGVSSLVSSFVVAFEDISPDRRLDLFTVLIDKLGPEDYLSILFVILQDRYGDEDIIKDFISGMLLKHTAVVQFNTIKSCLDILTDSLDVRPRLMKQIFVAREDQSHENRLLLLAKLPTDLLQATQLMPKVTKALRSNDFDAQRIRSSYAAMVQQILELVLQERKIAHLSSLIATLLSTLIGSFPVSESLHALNAVLQRGTEELHQKVLDTCTYTISQAQSGDVNSCNVCYELLPSLISIVETSDNPEIQQNAIRCIDSIIKVYGKVNTEETMNTMQFIAGPLCLQSSNSDIQVAALNALMTMLTVLGEESLPVCPTIISISLDHLAQAMMDGQWNADLHNAVYAVFGALLSVIPWVVTGDKLDRLLQLSYTSAVNSTDSSCDNQRMKTLSLLAKNMDASSVFTALGRSWGGAVETDYIAVNEHLQVLETSIDEHPKSIIAANATVLIEHFMDIMDLRTSFLRRNSEDRDEADLVDIEETSSSVLIKMIYKLNDAHFRPLFIRMSEWATAFKGKDQIKTTKRLTTWFSFLHKFFSTLQSIVINYAVYILDAAIETLKAVSLGDSEYELLWQKTILTLHATFEHDQDDFWKSPTRFADLCTPLVAQLRHIATDEDRDIFVSCVTTFAVAVESAEHRADIHAKILEHFKSDNPVVRRNMFTCQISLTKSLGEEWIALFDSSSTYPVMSEAFEDDDEDVENEARKWKLQIEDMTGESLDTRLQ